MKADAANRYSIRCLLVGESRAGRRQPRLVHPHWHYEHEPETLAALDLIFSGYFSGREAGVIEPLRDALLAHGDYYRHLAGLKLYLEADERLVQLYAEPDAGARTAILNVAGPAMTPKTPFIPQSRCY